MTYRRVLLSHLYIQTKFRWNWKNFFGRTDIETGFIRSTREDTIEICFPSWLPCLHCTDWHDIQIAILLSTAETVIYGRISQVSVNNLAPNSLSVVGDSLFEVFVWTWSFAFSDVEDTVKKYTKPRLDTWHRSLTSHWLTASHMTTSSGYTHTTSAEETSIYIYAASCKFHTDQSECGNS